MRRIILTRYGYFQDATFGIIRFQKDPDFRPLFSVEREWNYNKRFISCIPPGLYKLQPHSGSKYKNTFALVSEKLRVFATEQECEYITDRYAIILHPGSWGYNFEGCIGAGYNRISNNIDRWGIGSTIDGISFLTNYIPKHNITHLRIRNYRFTLTDRKTL